MESPSLAKADMNGVGSGSILPMSISRPSGPARSAGSLGFGLALVTADSRGAWLDRTGVRRSFCVEGAGTAAVQATVPAARTTAIALARRLTITRRDARYGG